MMDEARVEKVARALCQHANQEPDAMVSNAGSIQINTGREELYPRWHDYRDEARKFIVMYAALNS
jgi:hypothetical protein